VRILYLIPTLEIGGAETDLVRIVPRLDRARFQPIVWPFLQAGALASSLEALNVPVLPPVTHSPRKSPGVRAPWRDLGLARVARPLLETGLSQRALALLGDTRYIARLASAIARGIRAARPDIVHAILPNAYVFGAIANVLGRWPLVMSRVSQNWYQQDMRLLGLFERQVAHRLTKIVIGNSSLLLEELRAEGLAEHKLRLVHNGIDVDEFTARLMQRAAARAGLGVADDTMVLSIVANLHPYKGHADLLHALALVRDALPKGWRLLAAGRDIGGRQAELTRLTEALGLAPHVRFLGERRDVADVLSAADIHISASHTEGFPNNILEAMCARLPVVATAVGGVADQIEDGRTGLLVRPKDPASLAKGIDMLAWSPEIRSRFGAAARAAVESRFPLARTVAAYEAIYAEVARRGPGSGCRADAA
jgi:glycosyltransferase involved in cell wall biosynthesis